MNKKFTKDDLHSGYVVEFRNGERLMVARAGDFTKILVDFFGRWYYLGSGWGSDLCAVPFPTHLGAMPTRFKKELREWDIMRVYGLILSTNNKKYGQALSLCVENRPLLWERKEAVKMTVAEICAKLGYDVEIVAEA